MLFQILESSAISELKCLKPLALFFNHQRKSKNMNNLLRGLIAGYGAKKLGGGCFGTILVFVIIWWALGHCN
jgi:hypothetical protein